MRFNLTLKVEKTRFGNKLPINYSYLLSSWIYKVISKSDAAYAAWLHNNGFRDGSKIFRFFVFSNLNIPKVRLEGDRLCILSDTVSLCLSFLPEKSTEEFIKGLFREQQFALGDKKSKVQFEVQQVELIPQPELTVDTAFRTISPVVVSVKEPGGRVSYVSPEKEEYGAFLLKNLKEKYKIYYGREYPGPATSRFELLSPPKSRLVTIKADTPDETKVRGYNFTFRFHTDTELLELMYASGCGEKGSMGFGMLGTSINV